MTIELNKPFSRNAPADEEDMRVVKRTLNWLGYYTPYKKIGLVDFPDAQIFESLKAFQKDHNLPVTGDMREGDETLLLLNQKREDLLKGKR